MSSRGGRLAVVAVVVGATLAWTTWAQAGFTRSASASLSVSTGALAAPTGLAASGSCVLLAPRVTLTWTPTTSTYATGYVVRRRLVGGVFTTVATLSGRSTSTYVDTVVLPATTYQYVVQASYASWTADSAQAAATTPLVC